MATSKSKVQGPFVAWNKLPRLTISIHRPCNRSLGHVVLTKQTIEVSLSSPAYGWTWFFQILTCLSKFSQNLRPEIEPCSSLAATLQLRVPAKLRLLARVQRHQIDCLSHTARAICSHGSRTAGKILQNLEGKKPENPTVLQFSRSPLASSYSHIYGISMNIPCFVSECFGNDLNTWSKISMSILIRGYIKSPYIGKSRIFGQETKPGGLFPEIALRSPDLGRPSLRSMRAFSRAEGTSKSPWVRSASPKDRCNSFVKWCQVSFRFTSSWREQNQCQPWSNKGI